MIVAVFRDVAGGRLGMPYAFFSGLPIQLRGMKRRQRDQ
jgi:hypothetical protein